MWHDNETSKDLVGYQSIANALAELCTSPTLLPLTVGLYGSWGAGKSSVLAMMRDGLKSQERSVCVHFDGWQLEPYDDVRAALMSTVLEALAPHVPSPERVNSVRVKIDWLRAAGLAAKGIARFGSLSMTVCDPGMAGALAAGEALAEAHEAVSIERTTPATYAEELASAARSFRDAFAQLITDAGLDSVVVLVDDLDRCLPESVISILEAIKLFMAVPGTSFVLAVDDQVVNLAVMERFASASNPSEMARNYLDKLIQVPVLLPSLSPPESETFVYLLYAQAGLDEEEFDKLYARVVQGREDPSTVQCLNYGVAQEVLPPEALASIAPDFAVAQAAGPILSRLAGGNPRTIKRFLNTIELRLKLWPKSIEPPDKRLLAKLLLLERFHKERFEELAKWQAAGAGHSREVVELESLAVDGSTSPDPLRSKWFEQPGLVQWLKSEPTLDDDLGPYFGAARVVAIDAMQGGQRLSPMQQGVLARVRSTDRRLRGLGAATMKTLDASQAEEIVRILEAAAIQGGAQSRDLDALLEVGIALPIYAASAVSVIEELPSTDVTAAHAAQLGSLARAEPALGPRVIQILTALAASGSRSSKAAQQILDKLDKN